ncbi:MAG: oligosaccharide flippase family protein [Chitinophagaceae bacterium]
MELKKLILQSVIWRGLYFFTVLILNVLIARYFKASGSGWIYFISNAYALILLVASVSLESGMGFFASKNEVSTVKLLNLSMAWTFIVGLVVFVLSIIYVDKPDGSHPFDKRLFLVSSFSYVCGNILTGYCASIFYARKNFALPNMIFIFCNVLLVAVLWITITGRMALLNANSYLYIYFLAFLLQGLLVASVLGFYSPGKWTPVLPSLEELKKLLRYSLVAFAANVIFFFVYRVDYWFVKTYCSAEDLGNYIQVSKLGQLIITLPSIMASAVFPMVAGGQKEEVNRGLKRLSRISLIVIGACCFSLAVTGKWIFPVIFGSTFSSMYHPFILLIPGFLSISALYPLTAYYSGKNQMMVNIKGSLAALLFIMIADYIFIPRWGIRAAALISSMGYILYHAYVLMIFRKEYNTSLSGFFAIKRSDFVWMKDSLFTTMLK